MKMVFSENPESDLWRELLQFTYEANIERYWEKKGFSADSKTIDSIIGAFLQAKEYYQAAQNANLQIAPLLLYYGSTNLIYGMVNLISGKINDIKNHGMKIIVPQKMNYIADTLIRFVSPDDGGVHVFAKYFGFDSVLTNYEDWRLGEFLDSLAEINQDYIRCYNVPAGKIAMLSVFNTPDGKVEKIYFSDTDKESILDLMNSVDGFDKSYLRVIEAHERESNRDAFILRHKLTGEDISEKSYSGQPYIRAGHIKNGNLITIPTLLNMYISLFILASLCRYHPEKWSPFVLKDSTGEKLLIEKLMYYSRRMIPNLVLNKISDDTIQYSASRYKEIDTVKLVGEHQVQEMIDKKLQKSNLSNQNHQILL